MPKRIKLGLKPKETPLTYNKTSHLVRLIAAFTVQLRTKKTVTCVQIQSL